MKKPRPKNITDPREQLIAQVRELRAGARLEKKLKKLAERQTAALAHQQQLPEHKPRIKPARKQ